MPLLCSFGNRRTVLAVVFVLFATGLTLGQSGDAVRSLPAISIPLQDLSAFKPTGSNWKIVGNVAADLNQEQVLTATQGKGTLANLSDTHNRKHLFTKFEHGDIEIEMEVMMAKGSNSGIYLQGRYEVQLFDSWGKADRKYAYMGGIYQRTDPVTNQGFEGSAPRVNACKAPGLWQTLKIIFKAPEFNVRGEKIANARFDGVWLNGMLVQDQVEVTGPTRSAAFEDEQATGPLMIQGNHGRVAFRNIRYKAYDRREVKLKDLQYREYKTPGEVFRKVSSLEMIGERKVDSISRHLATQRDIFLMDFRGRMSFPRSGTYLFTFQTGGGGFLVIGRDTIIRHDGANGFDQEKTGLYKAQAGDFPFTLVYNKPVQHRQGLALYVEGPGMARHALQAPGSAFVEPQVEPLIIPVRGSRAVIQRSFMTFESEKRTHCLSVGTTRGLHYTVDLETASIFQIWDGNFLDATPMWHRRGNGQVATPLGPRILLRPLPLIMKKGVSVPLSFREYTLDARGMPEFTYAAGGMTVSDKLTPLEDRRAFTRHLTIQSAGPAEYQLAEGTVIDRMGDGGFAVNDKEYYLLVDTAKVKCEIRLSGNRQVLVVTAAERERLDIEYTILW